MYMAAKSIRPNIPTFYALRAEDAAFAACQRFCIDRPSLKIYILHVKVN